MALACDSDGWLRRQEMQSDANGWWTLELKLEPGEYRFRYVADDQWYTDFASNGVEVTKMGWSSVLVVPPGKSAPSTLRRDKARAGGALKVA